MDTLSLIMLLSAVMWYLIDRAKEHWSKLSWGKWITIGCSAALSFAISFGYKLDLIYALGAVGESSVLGTVITALSLMGGSSGIAEIVGAAKNKFNNNNN